MFWILIFLSSVIIFYEKRITLATTFICYWLFFNVIGCLFYNKLEMTKSGMTYILIMGLVFYIGTLLGGNIQNRKINHIKILNLKKEKKFLYVALFCLMIVIFISAKRYGYSLVNISKFLDISRNVRWNKFGSRTLFEKLAMPFIYSACAMDGYFWVYTYTLKIKYQFIFPKICAGMILAAILSTGKSLLIWAIILWLSGFLTGNQVFLNVKIQKGAVSNYLKKNYKKLIFFIILIIAMLMFMMFARTQSSIGQTFSKLINYAFAQVPCFNMWFENMEPTHLQYSMGRQSFFGIFDELNMSSGIADNWQLNIKLFEQGIFSNIYTVFRGVIEDYGVVGSVFFWFIIGIIGGKIEKQVQHKKNKCVYATFLLAFYVFILFSFLISSWHYLTIVMAVCFFGIELSCIERIKLCLYS